jgi:outer membrane protein assembly factor BamD
MSRMGGPARIALLALVTMMMAGCATKRGNIPTGVTEPDKYLYEQGTKAMEDRKWFTAREYFQQLVDGYPQSPLRADAKLGLGDAYLNDGSTEGKLRAEREFQEFLSYFPTHQRADYAQFKLAMTHFDQMPKAERDQTETRAALDQFAAFRQKYPNSALASEVIEKERIARDRLSESIYKVGYFYHKARWYPGAISRFRQVLQEDPQFTNRDAVYYYLAEALVTVKLEAEALPLLEKLEAEFVESEFLAQGAALKERVNTTLASRTPGEPAGTPQATPGGTPAAPATPATPVTRTPEPAAGSTTPPPPPQRPNVDAKPPL